MIKKISIPTYLLFILILFFSFACKQGEDSPLEELTTGGIKVKVVWNTPEQTALNSKSNSYPPSFAAPAGVVTIQAVITGDGMTTITSNHNAASGSGRTDNIPVGSNRQLVLKGLDSGNSVTYKGASISVDITAGVVADGGTVTMEVLDTEAPTSASIIINNNDANTTSTTVTLALSAQDNRGVVAYYASEAGVTPSPDSITWQSITASTNISENVNFTLSSGNGTKTVFIWFKDAEGNISSSASDTIFLNEGDTESPTNPTISINNGDTTTTATVVTLSISAQDDVGVAAYFVAEVNNPPAGSDGGWVSINAITNYSADVAFILSSESTIGNYTKTVYVWFKDAAGNVSASASDAITLQVTDATKPIGVSIFINNGDGSTTASVVTLTIDATDDVGITAYYASESSITPSNSEGGWTSVTSTTSYFATVAFILSSGASEKTVYVWFKDAAGNVSTVISDTITLSVSDGTAPTSPTVTINSGDESTTSISVTLNLSATDNIGITGYYASETNVTPTSNAIGWVIVNSTTSYSGAVSFTLSSESQIGNHTKTVYVWYKDNAGNISAVASDSITLSVTDTTAPASPAITIIGDTEPTTTTSVTLNLSATDEVGVTDYFASENNATPSNIDTGWISVTVSTNYIGNVPFSLSSGEGTKTVYVWFRDAAGNISPSAYDSIELVLSDAVAPTNPVIAINNDDASTDTTTVVLNLTVADTVGVTAYYVSESSLTPTAVSSWVSVASATVYSANVAFTLSSESQIGNHTKTVYAWYKDAAGNISSVASDSITLSVSDNTAPTGAIITINNNDSSTSSTAVVLNLTVNDDVGVTGYYPSESSAIPSSNAVGWITVTTTTNYSASVAFTLISEPVGSHTKTVFVWFKDAAGNISPASSDDIILSVSDETAPINPAITINNGDVSTDITAVTLDLSAEDNVGVTGYYVSESSVTPDSGSSWNTVSSSTTYTANVSFTLSGESQAGSYTRTVYAWYRDAAGHISGSSNDTIILEINDTVIPTLPTILINGGSSSTDSTSVTLNLSASDNVGVTAYYASETNITPESNALDWESVTSATSYFGDVSFILSSSGEPGSYTRIVYIWYKDAAGNVSQSAVDSIILNVSDTTGPTPVTITINNDDASTDSTAVTLNLSASDNVGVTGYYTSENSVTPDAGAVGWNTFTAITPYSANVAFTLSDGSSPGDNSKIVYVWYKDTAGNLSLVTSDSITLVVDDVTAPTNPGVTINSNAISTTSKTVTLNLSAEDDGGVTGYYVSESNVNPTAGSAWIGVTSATSYSGDVPFELSSGIETKTVYVWFKDAADLISVSSSATISYEGAVGVWDTSYFGDSVFGN